MWLGFRLRKTDPVADNAAPNTPWGSIPWADSNGFYEKDDLPEADLEANGGKLQPEVGPKFKRKEAPYPKEQ